MTIQDLCRDKKAALHMTSQDIADQSGVPLSTVNNFFANASKAPSINTAGPICAVLGISIDEFFGITDKLTMKSSALKMIHSAPTKRNWKSIWLITAKL